MRELSFPRGSLLRVTALQPTRRRAGLAFNQSNPRDLTPEDLGFGLAAMMALVTILSDPWLKVVLVEGDEVREITAEERDDLLAFIQAESARVDADDPPTTDAAEAARAEADRVAAEAAKAEEDRLAAEAAKAEEDRVAAEAAKAEEDRVAAEAAKAEEDRVAAEATKAEEERVAAEAAAQSSKPTGHKKAKA